MTTLSKPNIGTPSSRRIHFNWNLWVSDHITRNWVLTLWLVVLTVFAARFTVGRLQAAPVTTIVILAAWAISVAATVYAELIHRHTAVTLWLRNNLYNSITNIQLTLIIVLGLLAAVFGLFRYAFETASFVTTPTTNLRAEVASITGDTYCFNIGEWKAEDDALTDAGQECFPRWAFAPDLSETVITETTLGTEPASFCFDTLRDDPENGRTCFKSTADNPALYEISRQFGGANWGAVYANVVNMMVFRFNRAELWRVAAATALGVTLTAISLFVYRPNFENKRVRRTLTYVWLVSPIIFYILLAGVHPTSNNVFVSLISAFFGVITSFTRWVSSLGGGFLNESFLLESLESLLMSLNEFAARVRANVLLNLFLNALILLLAFGLWRANAYVNRKYPPKIGELERIRLGRILVTVLTGLAASLAFISLINTTLLIFSLYKLRPLTRDEFFSEIQPYAVVLMVAFILWQFNKYITAKYPPQIAESTFIRFGRSLLKLFSTILILLSFFSVLSIIFLIFGLFNVPPTTAKGLLQEVAPYLAVVTGTIILWGINKYLNSKHVVQGGETGRDTGWLLLKWLVRIFAFLSFFSMIIVVSYLFSYADLLVITKERQAFTPLSPDVDWGGFMLTLIITAFAIVVSFPLGVMLALGRRSTIRGIPNWITYPVALIIMLLGLAFSTPSLLENARSNFEVALAYWPLILPLVAFVFQRVWKGNVVSGFCTMYIEFIRGIPLITVLFLSIILFPIFLPPEMEFLKTWRVMWAFALFAAAYLAENVRGGLQAIPQGQYEAADSLGLSTVNKYRLIIMPQALRTVIPAITNQYIGLFKDTTLVAIVGFLDILGVANSIAAQPQWLGVRREAYLFIAVLYFIVSAFMAGYAARLEKQSGLGER